MEAMKTTTVIVNSTNDVLKLKVGGHQHYAEVASIDKAGRYDVHVNVNETYREFLLQAVGGTNEIQSVIVTSDDCCDNECITIKAAADTGKLEAHRVARKPSQVASEVTTGADSGGKLHPKSAWFASLHRLWAQKKPF